MERAADVCCHRPMVQADAKHAACPHVVEQRRAHGIHGHSKVCEHYAPIWVKWADTFFSNQRLLSVKHIPAACIVHKDFWVAVIQADFKMNRPLTLRRVLVGIASMEGNLSIIEAFAEVFGTAEAWAFCQRFENFLRRLIFWANAMLWSSVVLYQRGFSVVVKTTSFNDGVVKACDAVAKVSKSVTPQSAAM